MLEQALGDDRRRSRRVMRVRLLVAPVRRAVLLRPSATGCARSAPRRPSWPPSSTTRVATALAAAARRRRLWDPAHLERRLGDSTELLRAALRGGGPRAGPPGPRLARRRPAGDTATGRRRRPDRGVHGRRPRAAPAAVPVAGGGLAGDAGAAGRAPEHGRRLAAEALAAGIRPESDTAPQYYAIQVLAIRREQGRMGELEAAGCASWSRATPLVRPGAPRSATLLFETGRPTRRGTSSRAGRPRLRRHPADGDWMIADHACWPTPPPGSGIARAVAGAVRAAAALRERQRRDRPGRRLPRRRGALSGPAGRWRSADRATALGHFERGAAGQRAICARRCSSPTRSSTMPRRWGRAAGADRLAAMPHQRP